MKKLVFALGVLCFFSSYSARSQWVDIPIPVNNSLYCVDIHPSGVCFAGGIDFIKSTDFGQTWTEVIFTGPQATYFDNVIINSIQVLNDTTVVCVGRSIADNTSIVIKSTDGGANWSVQYVGAFLWREFLHVEFFDEQKGALCGKQGEIFVTNDGGNSWTQVPSGTTNLLEDITYGATSNDLVCVGQLCILTSGNGGSSWAYNDQTGKIFRSVKYSPTSAEFSVTYTSLGEPYFSTSTDNGVTWNDVQLHDHVVAVRPHDVLPNDTVHIAYEWQLEVSFDNGTSTFGFPDPQFELSNDIEFDSGVGLAVSSQDGLNLSHVYRYDYSAPQQFQQIVDFIFEDTICEGHSTTVYPNNLGLDSYEWFVDGNSVSTQDSLVYTFSGYGNFLIELVTTFNGHYDTISQNISVNGLPIVVPFTYVGDTAVCEGTNFGFQVHDILGSTGYSVSSSIGPQLYENTITATNHITTGFGNVFSDFDVYITKWGINLCDSIGITDTIHITVEAYPDPNELFYVEDTLVCKNAMTNIIVPNPIPNYTYYMYEDGINAQTQTANSSGDTLFFSEMVLAEQEYTFEVSSPIGCSVALTHSDSTNIDEAKAQFDILNVNAYVHIDSLVIVDTSTIVGDIFHWTTNGSTSMLSDTNTISPIIAFDSTGYFLVQLNLETATLGCTHYWTHGITVFNSPPDSSNNIVCSADWMNPMEVSDMAIDASGNIITVGYKGQSSYNGTTNNGFNAAIQKLDANGNLLWEWEHEWLLPFKDHWGTLFGTVTTDHQGNIYVTGCSNSEYFKYQDTVLYDIVVSWSPRRPFVMKLDSSGNFLWWIWSHTDGGGFSDVLVDESSGNLFIAGEQIQQECYMPNDTIYINLFGLTIIQTDYDGNYIQHFESQTGQYNILGDHQPQIGGWGHSGNTVHISPQLFMRSDNTILAAGEIQDIYIAFGTDTLPNSSFNYRSFTATLDPFSGNPGWTGANVLAQFNNGYFANNPQVDYTFDEGDNLYLSVNSCNSDIIPGQTLVSPGWGNLIVKFDAGYNYQWHRRFQGGYIEDLEYGGDNRLFFTGYYQDYFIELEDQNYGSMVTMSEEDNVFIGTLDSVGSVNWLGTYGSANYDFPEVLTGTYCGDMYFSGRTQDYFGSHNDTASTNVVLNSIDYGSFSGNYIVKFGDIVCQTSSCLLSCTDSSYFPSPFIQYNDTILYAPGYTSYQWYYNGTPIPGATDSIYYYSSNGQYSLEVQNLSGCTGISDLNGTCINQNLMAQVSSGYNDSTIFVNNYDQIQWYMNGTPIAGANDSLYYYTDNGDYFVEVIDSNGCTATSYIDTSCLNMDYFVSPTIQVSNYILWVPSTYQTYQWYLDGAPMIGETTEFNSTMQNGAFNVIVTDANGCAGSSDTLNFIYDVSIVQNPGFELGFYPNPFNDAINVEINSSKSDQFTFEIISVDGKIVRTGSIQSNNGYKTLYLSDLSSGIYTMRLYSNDLNESIQIIKTK